MKCYIQVGKIIKNYTSCLIAPYFKLFKYSRGVSEGGYMGALFGRIEGAALLLALLLGGHLRPSIVYILTFSIKKKKKLSRMLKQKLRCF